MLTKSGTCAMDDMRKVLLVLKMMEKVVAEVVHGYDHQRMCYRDDCSVCEEEDG